MSETIKMRTRMLPSMTNWEVEQYLQRNDIIFVPVGVNELHGTMPLDIEYVFAEGYARVIAEAVDGLVLPNLVYFSAGGTEIGRGTLQVTMQDSISYLYKICLSLLNQGFRRIVLIPAHSHSKPIITIVMHDLFTDTKVPIMHMQPAKVMQKLGIPFPMMDWSNHEVNTIGDKLGCATVHLGFYNICGRIDDVPTGAEMNDAPGAIGDDYLGKMTKPFECIDGYGDLFDLMDRGGDLPMPVYFDAWSNHGCQPLPETREDVRREGAIGEKVIREAMGQVDWSKYMDAMRRVDRCYQEKIVPKYADVLPRNRFSPNNR